MDNTLPPTLFLFLNVIIFQYICCIDTTGFTLLLRETENMQFIARQKHP